MKGSAHVLLGEGSGKNLEMFLLKKGTFIMINEFKHRQTWKNWPYPVYHFAAPLNIVNAFKCQKSCHENVLPRLAKGKLCIGK